MVSEQCNKSTSLGPTAFVAGCADSELVGIPLDRNFDFVIFAGEIQAVVKRALARLCA
jgi:hypothetical protein